MSDAEHTDGQFGTDDGTAGFRQRALDRICDRQFLLVGTFSLATAVFLISLFLVFAVDLPPASTTIALVDAGLTGAVSLASFAVLWQCRRYRRSH